MLLVQAAEVAPAMMREADQSLHLTLVLVVQECFQVELVAVQAKMLLLAAVLTVVLQVQVVELVIIMAVVAALMEEAEAQVLMVKTPMELKVVMALASMAIVVLPSRLLSAAASTDASVMVMV